MSHSRKLAGPAAVATTAVLLAASPAAFAASHPWQAVAGHFKTKSAATKEVTKLSGKGLSGYKVETEKTGQFSNGKKFEVEKGFTTKKKATAAVTKLRKDGAKAAAIEHESNN